jgi:MFS family permease
MTDNRSLLGQRPYALYLASRLSLIIATQMLSVAVGWQVYAITRSPLELGFTGLALFLPAFLLAIPGGQVADRLDRKRIILVSHAGVATAAVLLALHARSHATSVRPIYAVLVCLGSIRAFSGPAGQALMPNLVPRAQLERAVALGSTFWQVAMIAGPSLGGVLYAAFGGATGVYVCCAASAAVAFVCVAAITVPTPAERPSSRDVAATEKKAPVSMSTLLAGIRYVWKDRPILGSITLDLFAVLLGGAVALLPIFARDVLVIGPWGLGILRSAPAVGAAITALVLSVRPIQGRAGATMFAGVFVFGLATIAFGVSKSFAVSLVALFVLGAADMVSVVVRSTLIQLRTPDEMRGRVSAVNMVFIGASNELGEFESGVTAAWLGPELAVIVGGVGTCVVVLACLALFPTLRRVDRME